MTVRSPDINRFMMTIYISFHYCKEISSRRGHDVFLSSHPCRRVSIRMTVSVLSYQKPAKCWHEPLPFCPPPPPPPSFLVSTHQKVAMNPMKADQGRREEREKH